MTARKLYILMLNYEFPPIGGGGANAHLALLKEYAKQEGLKVDVLTSAPEPGFFEERFSDNVTIYKVGIHKKQLHYWRKIEVLEWLIKAQRYYHQLINRNDYNLVHAFFAFPSGYLCYRTARRLPYIISLRGSDVPGIHHRLQLEYKLLGPLFCSIWKNAAMLVACSKGLKERAHRFLSFVPIEVIPNGVDLQLFRPAEGKQRSDCLRLITVGRLSPTKRLDLLIEAVDILIKKGRNVNLTIVGGGALEKHLKNLVNQRDLSDVITLTGLVAPELMPSLYNQNDIYISATAQEGMSNAMLEAMASGLPIITTKCEGVEELIDDNGIVLDEPTSANLALAVIKLAEDADLYKRMSTAARRRIENFTWSRAAQRYMSLYGKLLSDRVTSE